MKLTDFLKKLFGDKESMTLDELTQAAESFKDAKFVDLNEGGYVDEGKYSNVSAKLFTANNTIKTLREAAQAFEGVDIADLKRQLDDEKAGRKKDRQDWELRAVLTAAGCKDPDYVMYKLGDTVEFEENGGLKDKDMLLESCKKDYASMFETERPGGTGSFGNFARTHGSDKPMTLEEFNKLPYMEQYKIKTQQPEAYQAMTAAQKGEL